MYENVAAVYKVFKYLILILLLLSHKSAEIWFCFISFSTKINGFTTKLDQ